MSMNGSSNKCKRTYYCTYPSKNFHSLFLSFSASSSEVSFFEQRTTINPITTFKREITKAQPKPIFLLLPIMPTPNAKAMAIINKIPRSVIYKYLVHDSFEYNSRYLFFSSSIALLYIT